MNNSSGDKIDSNRVICSSGMAFLLSFYSAGSEAIIAQDYKFVTV